MNKNNRLVPAGSVFGLSSAAEMGTINLILEEGGETYGYDQADRAGGGHLSQHRQHSIRRKGGRAEDQRGYAGEDLCGSGTAWLSAQYGGSQSAGWQRRG